MSNKGTRSILILLISFLSLFGCPFTISADNTLVPTFSGTDIQTDWNNAGGHLTEYHESSNTNTGLSKLSFTFSDHYYGMVSFTYYFGSSTYAYGDVFIADGYGEFYYRNSSGSQNYVTAVRIDYVGLVVPDSNVDLTLITQLLTAISGNTNNTVLQIQNVLDELIESNGYLEEINEWKARNYPIESFGIISYAMYYGLEEISLFNYGHYTYPIFKLTANKTLMNIYIQNNQTFDFIFMCDYDMWNVNKYLEFFTENYSLASRVIQVYPVKLAAGNAYLYHVTLVNNTGSNVGYILKAKLDGYKYIPIYIGNIQARKYLSTDFALNFDMTNPIIDNLNVIANGTSQSNSAAGTNDTATNQFEDVAGDMYDYEDSFNSDMNSSLNQIDTNFNIGSQFGSKFSASAQWVSQQFNTLTASTPFGSVISFSLLLGLALLIIGKVLR